jgi:hypothetical protein
LEELQLSLPDVAAHIDPGMLLRISALPLDKGLLVVQTLQVMSQEITDSLLTAALDLLLPLRKDYDSHCLSH